MKGAVTGALVFEGLAKDLDEAAELAASGRSPSRRATSTTVWIDGGRHLGLDVYAHREKQNLWQHRLYQHERADGEDFAYGR